MVTASSDVPVVIPEIATWFNEGVIKELEYLEKKGGSQRYELQSGELVIKRNDFDGVYRFILADGTRIPEDSSGQLKFSDRVYKAQVIGQIGNIIRINIRGKEIPQKIHWAELIIDDTALLRSLSEKLEEVAKGEIHLQSLGSLVFHPETSTISSNELPPISSLNSLSQDLKIIMCKTCGSQVSFIWGPPGTGKTFLIAHLVTWAIESGNKVLVTSHTNAAVDQALYETVKNDVNGTGPLYNHDKLLEGKIIRLGASNEKLPNEVRVEKIVEQKSEGISKKILDHETRLNSIREDIRKIKIHLDAWLKIDALLDQFRSLKENFLNNAKRKDDYTKKQLDLDNAINTLRIQRRELENSIFSKKKKKQKLDIQLNDLSMEIRQTETSLNNIKKELINAKPNIADKRREIKELIAFNREYSSRNETQQKIDNLIKSDKELSESLKELKDLLAGIELKVIDEAQALFCTLTANYMKKEIQLKDFNTVIIDEISMALPPLVFLATGRATDNAILVGDYLQLPPIIRSDDAITDQRLKTDVFKISKIIDDDLNQSSNYQGFHRLNIQHRMIPEIANIARHLVYYGENSLDDHDDVKNRDLTKINETLSFLPENPLLIIDTADLNCWSGKQFGTLSRFNFYSACISVELAAMASLKLKGPNITESQPIGIITPFAAQRRLLSQLVNDLDLNRWVAAGTVHTFQGNQADIVIFDSTLDEPYWTARLCNPKGDVKEVIRDLNVAVTRARNKFIFVGSSEWLHKYAKINSPLGQLWFYLVENADLISALDVINSDYLEKMNSLNTDNSTIWNIPEKSGDLSIQILDESSFFDVFRKDIRSAKKMIFALAPFFGEYRWPMIQPLFHEAVQKGVEVTIVTPPLAEAQNKSFVTKAIKNLRQIGVVVVTSSGLHGKDVIIDEQILYTGSMNWSSHRGRQEVIHRFYVPEYVRQCLHYLQARHIRNACINTDGTPRVCPYCGEEIHIVNQRKQRRFGTYQEKQSLKVACANKSCNKYIRDVDEKLPFTDIPRCIKDNTTKMRKVKKGRGFIWQCPKHLKNCPTYKVVPGDP